MTKSDPLRQNIPFDPADPIPRHRRREASKLMALSQQYQRTKFKATIHPGSAKGLTPLPPKNPETGKPMHHTPMTKDELMDRAIARLHMRPINTDHLGRPLQHAKKKKTSIHHARKAKMRAAFERSITMQRHVGIDPIYLNGSDYLHKEWVKKRTEWIRNNPLEKEDDKGAVEEEISNDDTVQVGA